MRAAVLALLVAAVASADEPPAVTAARQRQDALTSVGFDVRLKSDRETATLRLRFDGSKARYERQTSSVPRKTWVAASDGERVRVQLLWTDPATGTSAGTINLPNEGVCRGDDLIPLTLAARGLDPAHCPCPIDSLTPTGTEEVRGRVCDVFTGTVAGLPGTFWFDPQSGYALRQVNRGGTVTEVESSNDNPAGAWLPTKWTVTKADGTVVRECVVERSEVGKQYPAAEFDPPWPAGLRVHDQVAWREYVSDADGVLQSADPVQDVWDRVLRLWWVPVLAVVLPVGLIAWRVWRKRK
jgi:hypothetical protein